MVADSFSVYSWYSVFAFVWNRFDGDGLWFLPPADTVRTVM